MIKMKVAISLIAVQIVFFRVGIYSVAKPLVINTWNFLDAGQAAWEYVQKNFSAVTALEVGCTVCEEKQCDFTVGYGGSPDENGETTLDALIFDGTTINMGAVGCLRRIKSAVSVARHVLENTRHSILVGELATAFAVQMGFKEESLQTNYSKKVWGNWRDENCQPNFWENNVRPDPQTTCGPYTPTSKNDIEVYESPEPYNIKNHDTIGMIVIDSENKIVAGTSTNGANHKIPGRVGDSPIPGAGAYADHEAGAAVATGDGDVMMRFLPSFLAVEEMRRGSNPESAAREAIRRIVKYYPDFFGAVIAVSKDGSYGAACNGMESFPYIIASDEFGKATLKSYNCSGTLASSAEYNYRFYYVLAIVFQYSVYVIIQ